MTLGETQRLFSRLVPRLLDQAHALGFEAALGECFRLDEQAIIHALGEPGRHQLARYIERAWPDLADALRNNGEGRGIKNSVHTLKLALDLLLFRDIDSDGDLDYLTTTEAHRPLGEWWELQHPLCRWGGRFGDGNHYSLEYNGVK